MQSRDDQGCRLRTKILPKKKKLKKTQKPKHHKNQATENAIACRPIARKCRGAGVLRMVAKIAPTESQTLPHERSRGAEFIFEGLEPRRGPEGPQKRHFKNFAGAPPRTQITPPFLSHSRPCTTSHRPSHKFKSRTNSSHTNQNFDLGAAMHFLWKLITGCEHRFFFFWLYFCS